MADKKFSTVEEYDREIEEVETELADIKGQLEKANAYLIATGVYADADWFRKAKAAQRYRGIEHQALLRERGSLARSQRLSRADSYSERFIVAARLHLDIETFKMISDEARDAAHA